MHYELYTQRFQDLGEELYGTVKAGESISIPAEIADDLESVELRSTTTDEVRRWYRDAYGQPLEKIE